jgi:hypothetical protein
MISIVACAVPPFGSKLSVEGEKVTVSPGSDGENAPVKLTLLTNGPTGDTDTVKSTLEA